MRRKIEFQKVSDAPIFSDSFSLAVSSVSDTGAGLFLFVESAASEDIWGTHEQGLGIFPNTKIGEHKRFAFIQKFGEEHLAFELPALDMTFPLIDVFPDGRILLVASRCQWRSKRDYDENGLIFNPATGERSHILLGDGIESVAVDALGRIWVSYFDEGIFGNFGWGTPGPKPIGVSGFNCFSAEGDLLWSFPFDDTFGPISDCYALNVHGETAFIHFYTEFPLCRISGDFQREYWNTNLKGCDQIAIKKTHVLFSGQYDDDLSVGYLAELGQGKIGKPRKVELTLPDGSPISSGRLQGRGPNMHYFDETGWYKFCLDCIDG